MIKNLFSRGFRLLLLVSAVVLSLNACALPEPQEYRNEQKLGLNEAVTALGQNLNSQLKEAWQVETGEIQSLVVDPILSIESGQQFKENPKVVSILSRELGSGFKMDEISPKSLASARYVLSGALSQRANLKSGNRSGCVLVVTILEIPTGVVKAKGQVSINGFPFEPTPFYEDSPIFLLDKSARLAKLLFDSAIGQAVSQEYLQYLPAKAFIQRGISSYEHEQFADATTFFSEAVAHSYGKTLTSYAGLYLSSQKLHRNDTATHTFTDLLTKAIEENHRLNINLQFSANSSAFISDQEMAKQYAWWLKHIAIYMKKNRQCLDISSHSSRSGDKFSNEHLSLTRAKTVQGIMAVTYPGIIKKSHVNGKGFQENIVGNGANDASDAVDRRIELSVINCSELSRLSTK